MNPSAPPPTYKQSLHAAMVQMARDPKACFVGYGLKPRGEGFGTFAGIHPDQLIEMPVAENLMVGAAIGLALAGRRPLVYIERFDFILNALDAIVNHLDKIERLSSGQFAPALILRVVQGNDQKPLYTGPTHTQDFTRAMRELVSFPVDVLATAEGIGAAYANAHASLRRHPGYQVSTMLIERKDLL